MVVSFFFFLMIRRPPRSTLFPYTNALPISPRVSRARDRCAPRRDDARRRSRAHGGDGGMDGRRSVLCPLRVSDHWNPARYPRPATLVAKLHRTSRVTDLDRKSTRLNSSHLVISYAVFCLKKKKIKN